MIFSAFSGIKIRNPRLQDYLPEDIKTLSTIGQVDENEFQFMEITSLSKRYTSCKSVTPIFVLPAIHRTLLQPLLQRLQYPVFSANVTSARSIEEAVHELYSVLNLWQENFSMN